MIKKLEKFFKSPKGALLFAILAYLTAISITYLEDKINKKTLIISALFTVLIIIITIIIFSQYLKLEIKEEYKKNNDILKAFIEAHGLGDFISKDELHMLESEAESIWVFSLDLLNNEQNNSTEDLIQKNLNDGKNYIFFIPNTNENIKKFKQKYNYKEGQVKFCLIPPEEFHIVFKTVIYDNKIAVQWFPSSKEMNKKNSNYYIKLDENYTMRIIGSAKLFLSKYCKN
jgi:hypothetical protein